MIEDEMIRWHHQLNGHESEQVPGDGDCNHEIQRCLLLGRKAMTNLDSILKSRDISFANKGPSSQSFGFSSSHVWM